MRVFCGPSERVLDAAMDSASDAGSDASVDMVAGDGSDVEKSVKDTAKKKRPQWDGRKHRHKTWLWRYLGYADATGNGPTARGKDRHKLKSSDPRVAAEYKKRNASWLQWLWAWPCHSEVAPDAL